MMSLKTITNFISEPWKLPNQWKWIPLEYICDIVIGGTPSTTNPQYWGNGHTWLSISDLDGEIIENSKKQITDLGVANSNVKLVQPGTVLMSFKLTIGKLGIAGTQLYTNEAIAALPIKPNWRTRFDSNFLFYVLKVIPLSNQVDLSAKGRTLNKKKIARILIPIPYSNEPVLSIKIQRAIVARIETLLYEIRESRKLLYEIQQKTNQMMDIVLEQVYSDLEFSQESFKPLGSLLRQKPQYGTSEKAHDNSQGVGILRMGNITTTGKISLDNLKYVELPHKEEDKYLLHEGDILFNRTNSAELVGKSAVFKGGDRTVFASYLIRLIPDESKINSKYLSSYINSKRGRTYVQSKLTRAIGMANVNAKKLAAMPVPIPDIKVQEQIVAYVDTIENEVDEILKILEQDKQSLDMIEKSILERAFRGEL